MSTQSAAIDVNVFVDFYSIRMESRAQVHVFELIYNIASKNKMCFQETNT